MTVAVSGARSTGTAASAAVLGAVPTDQGRRVDGPAVVDAAIWFVASQPGGAHRILLEHGRRENGTCAGCLTSPITWPCVVGMIAMKALELELEVAG